ncbi:phosphotransferase family protein [Paenibacillus sp. GYB003]|uniref:phosphotransferase family protein n=1 Tax=Paenibacillus sp. GYB003 TaxID=2994392 RepID=UPI002F963666
MQERLANGIKRMLNERYGLEGASVSPQKGGWAALAFRVTAGGRSYFLKAYEKSRTSTPKWTAPIDAYAPILLWLSRHTGLHGKVPVPLTTADGAFKCDDEHAVYMLYDYIDGETIGDNGLTGEQIRELAEIVAELHGYGGRLPVATDAIAERFDAPFVRQLRDASNRRLRDVPADVAELIGSYARQIGDATDAVETLSARLKESDLRLALCHTDIHNWNLMRTERRLMLIDWEGLKLAPVEADMMFFADKPYFADFLSVYRKRHERYEIDPDAMRFYKMRRVLEDAWEFVAQLVYDGQDAEEREATMIGLEKELDSLSKL